MIVRDISGIGIPPHNYVSISPAATPASGTQTITYRNGGASGNVVATLTLTYDANRDLTSVERI